jgi:hypothetical protein
MHFNNAYDLILDEIHDNELDLLFLEQKFQTLINTLFLSITNI